MLNLGVALGRAKTSNVGIRPVYSFNALLAQSIPDEIVCSRTSEASYRDNTGNWCKVDADTARLHHAINGGRVGLINEATRTRRNHYPYPASGTVSDHFTTGTSDITVVTNTNNPVSGDYANNDQVWRITNSTGGDFTYKMAGNAGSTAPHNIRVWHKIVSGTGHAIAQVGGNHSAWTGALYLNSRAGIEQVSLNITPSATSNQLEFVVPDGMTIEIGLAELQNNNIISSRYYPHATTPVLHGIGASATRSAEYVRIEGLDALGYSDNEGSAVLHGSFLGAENTNACFASFYDASSPNTDYQYLRPSPNGDTLFYGEGGNVAYNSGTFPIASKRKPLPLDMACAWSWSSVNGLNFWSTGTYNMTGTKTNTPQNIDTLALYRHDNGARDDSSCILTKIELYDQALEESALKSKSYRQYGFVDVTVAQSNIDIKMRGFGATAILDDGDVGGGDFITSAMMSEYVPNYTVIRGTDYYDGVTDADYGGGALLKSSNQATVGYYVDDTDPSNLIDGTDLIKLIGTVKENYGVLGGVKNFQIDLGQYESGRTVSEIGGIVKEGMQYLIDKLTYIGGASCEINFQMFTKRFNTDDDITWAWREMLRELVAENDNVIITAEPYNLDLDPASNAHYDSETGYINMYMQGQRRILKGLGVVDFGNVSSPTISSASYSGSTVTLNFNTENGANITSGDTAILKQLFRVLDDGVEQTVSSASVSGQAVTLTMSGALSGSVAVDYPYRLMDYDQDSTDENDAGTAVLVDDSCYKNPVAQFSGYAV